MFDVWDQAFMTYLSNFMRQKPADYENLSLQVQEELREELTFETLEYWSFRRIHEAFMQSLLHLIMKIFAPYLSEFVFALLLSLLFL